MTRFYAIGDIHGHRAKLEDALERIERDGGGRVVFLGDYIDRGPDSRGVIDLLAQGQAEGRDWVFLKGNHDRLFEWFIDPAGPRFDPHLLVGYHWFHKALGGVETLASYGITLPDRIRKKELAKQVQDVVPPAHAAFLRGLQLSHAQDGLFFAHAGIRPGVALTAQEEEDLLWIRDEFHDDTRDHGALIVHGHTPVKSPEHHGNRVNLDTGAGHGQALTTAVFEGGECFVLTPTGRAPLPPLPR